jgi:hypothetical protein
MSWCHAIFSNDPVDHEYVSVRLCVWLFGWLVGWLFGCLFGWLVGFKKKSCKPITEDIEEYVVVRIMCCG